MSHSAEISVSRIKGTTAYLVRFGAKRLADNYSATKIQTHLSKMIDQSSKAQFVLDMSNVEFMSSSVLGALVSLQKQADRKGGYVRMAAASGALLKMIKVTNMDKVMALFPSAAAAVKAA